MLVGATFAPVAIPGLIWASLAANVPLAMITVPLIIMALAPNVLSRLAIRVPDSVDGGGHTIDTVERLGSQACQGSLPVRRSRSLPPALPLPRCPHATPTPPRPRPGQA